MALKLNLGSGNDYKEGYLNCDKTDLIKVDIIADLEKLLPFEDNSTEEIAANHVLEHINNFIPLMHEIHRICQNNATISVKTPFYASWGQFNDPTHVRFFTPRTFDYFKAGNYSHEANCNKDMFECKARLNFAIGKAKPLNFIMNPIINLNHDVYCRFFAWIIPASEIIYNLRVIK